MVPQNRLLGNALEIGRGDINGIDIRQEGIRRIFRQRNLKIGIKLRSLCGIVRLPGLPEQLVYLRIRIAAIVGSLVCAEDFIGVVVWVERAAPADEIGLSPAQSTCASTCTRTSAPISRIC